MTPVRLTQASLVTSGYLVQPDACGWKPGLLSSIWHILTLGWVLRTCSLEKEIQFDWSERGGGSDDEQRPASGMAGRGGWSWAELGDHWGTEPAAAAVLVPTQQFRLSREQLPITSRSQDCAEKGHQFDVREPSNIPVSISSSISYSLDTSKIIENKPEEQINPWSQLNFCPRSDSHPLAVPETSPVDPA